MVLRNCTLFPDDPHSCDIIVIVRKTMGSLSFIGCLFIIVVIWLFKKYQIFTQRLILYLSIAAFLDSIAFLMPGFVPDGTLCEFQAWWLSFFDWSVLLWACCITFNLYQNAIKDVQTERYEIFYHIISWGVPLIFACLPFIGDHYGPAGVWCWIDADSSRSQIWRFTIWYIPMWCLLAVMLITYIYIVVKLRREVSRWEGTYRAEDERQKEMLKKDIKLLRAYPVVYMALAVFPSINRIQNAFNDNRLFWLLLLHTICSPLNGALNALVFAFDRETLRLLTWSAVKDAVFQRTHGTTHLITEYTFTQTTGSSSSSAASDNNVATINDEGPTASDTPTVVASNTSIQADKLGIDQESSATNHGADNVRERATYGSTDVV
ncbi:G-protein coupled receptor 1-like [Dendronephthya gigantea]|uniref:G-protein coupled receptor 1-like n=1 Tax=Dendronephthya gigantea TaxID=151771 RepID=UPI001069070B|nr:G-protein coupled receptor 1-like [Dendronephthya gigantea]